MEVFLTFVAEIIRNQRHAHFHHLFAVFFAVEDAERILFQSRVAVVTELILLIGEEIEQFLAVNGTALRAAYGIEVQDKVRKAQFPEELEGHGDDFCIDGRILGADFFDAELSELAVAAGLGAVMTEHGPHIVQFMDLRFAVELVLEKGPDDRCRIFRTQGHAAAAAVFKGIHFFGNDVCRFPDTP